MINFKDLTKALEEQVKNYNTSAQPYIIVRNKSENKDPSIAANGWVGIYRDSLNYEPHSTGDTPWLAEPIIRIEIQSASFSNEEDCEKRLDDIVTFVMEALESDRTISGNVAMITGYSIEYDDNFMTEQIQTFFQFATITITCEVRA